MGWTGGFFCGVEDRNVVEVQMAPSCSVKEEEIRSSSLAKMILSHLVLSVEVWRDPVDESVAMDWAVERTPLRTIVRIIFHVNLDSKSIINIFYRFITYYML